MFHKAVIERIDAELLRLNQARALLGSTRFDLADALLAQTKDVPAVKPRPTEERPADERVAQARVTQDRMAERKIGRTRRGWSEERRERTLRARRSRPAEPRALSNVVSAGPVVVSASALAEQRQQRAAATPSRPVAVPAAKPQDDGSLESMIRALGVRQA